MPTLDAVFADPPTFVNAILGFQPDPYQAAFQRAAIPHDPVGCIVTGCDGAGHKRIALAWGRQTGKTTAVGALSIWWALTHWGSVLTPNTFLICSKGLRQAFIMFRTVRFLIAGTPELEKALDKNKTTRSEIWFSRQNEGEYSRIIALPTGHDGSTIRGYTVHAVDVDEAAYVKDFIIQEVIEPMLATTDGLEILSSTPAGRDTAFYKAFLNPRWWTSRVPSSACPRITPEFLAEKQAQDPWGFRQEYEVEFLDDTTAWLPMKLLNDRVIDKYERGSMVPESAVVTENVATGTKFRHLYGADLGKVKSHSVVAIVRKEPGSDGITRYRLVYIKEFPLVVEETSEIFNQVAEWSFKLNRCFAIEKGCLDATNNMAFAENLRQKMPGIEPVQFTLKVKRDIMTWLRNLCESGRLILPFDHRLISQMNAQQYELKANDTILFSPPKGSNDDMLWALGLALYSDRGPGWAPLKIGRVLAEPEAPRVPDPVLFYDADMQDWVEDLARHNPAMGRYLWE